MIKIQEKDRMFCQKHQQAFDAAKKSLALLLECSEAAAAVQHEIFAGEPRYVQNVYLGNDIADGEIVRKAIRNLPRTFIEKISSYFTTEYRVPINYGAIQMDLLPTPPSENDDFWNWSADRVQAEETIYLKALLDLPLHYETVLEEISRRLKGDSFEKAALADLKKDCRRYSHHPVNGSEYFRVKGDTLQLTYNFCKCDSRYDGHYNWPCWQLTERCRIILDGIAHYKTKSFARGNRGSDMFAPLYEAFHTEKNLYEFPDSQCVSSIKLFKNGRVDIRFLNSVALQEFIDQYLRDEPKNQE